MASSDRLRVVVVGGGVTGLSAAYFLRKARPDASVVLFEARPEMGGNVRTVREKDFVVDTGPDSFIRTKPEALSLCKELGLDSELIQTESAGRHVYVAHRGALELMPGGMALAVPTRIEPLLRTPLLTARGKLRLLAEPFVPPRADEGDESIESFFERRVGAEGTRVLAGPLLGGIYAGDVAKLSVNATFPQLVELERKHGSLLRGFLALERGRAGQGTATPGLRQIFTWLRRSGEAQAPSPFLSFRGGMGTLVDALSGALPAGTVRANTPVERIAMVPGGGFRVEVPGEAVVADAVILATPAHVAARLVPDADAARELSAIPYVSTATVFFGLDRAKVRHDLAGFGFIVPRGEAKILAATWVSSKWSGRAPEGAALVRAFVGGSRDPGLVEGSGDPALVDLAREELERLMGPLGPASFSAVYRYTLASPQPVVGHAERVKRVRARLGALGGLHVAGAPYDGVGIPDCVRQAQEVASQVVEEWVSRSRALPSVPSGGAVPAGSS